MKLLDEIKPQKKNRVIDLVQEAGLDVSDWSNYSGAPSKNPKYCYEWSHVDKKVGVVLNIWYSACKVENEKIVLHHNFRADAERYSRVGNNKNKQWETRANRADEAIRTALRHKLPIRVILLDGDRKDATDPNAESSKPKQRELDAEFWNVEKYDDKTGDFVLSRGSNLISFEDQFSYQELGSDAPVKKFSSSSAYARDKKVRDWVLQRADGRCELCGVEGFKTSSSTIYLETHHIVALSEGGSDRIGNVIALCPNHHRQAHYGLDKEKLKTELILAIDK